MYDFTGWAWKTCASRLGILSFVLLAGAALGPHRLSAASPAWSAPQQSAPQDTLRRAEDPPVRDPVGDLNADAVRAGEFTGAILLPGTSISLAIGGFIKSVAITDSRLEKSGASFLPAQLGTSNPDQDGNYSIDATLSKLFFDARAPARHGRLRGYVEWDFNAANDGSLGVRPRLVFGSWDYGSGTVLIGHNWSTFMNPAILPEGLTEATVSGAVFARQAQLRWSQRVSESLGVDLALEAPGSGDFLFQNESVARTRWPDLVAAVKWDAEGRGQIRASGVVRRIADGADASLSPVTGWGAALSGYTRVGTADRIIASGAIGAGVARYLVGLGAGASGVVDAGEFNVLKNYGAFVAYRRVWNAQLRSTASVGHARTTPRDAQADDAFKNSTYTFINLMWTPMPYLTAGVEYAYGAVTAKDGSTRDNHRIVLGAQIF